MATKGECCLVQYPPVEAWTHSDLQVETPVSMHVQTSNGRNLKCSMTKLHLAIWRCNNYHDLTVGLLHH